ncbi:hypothetical protein TrVE_jg8169 [Triparma verrucosa]|uniref:NAD-dependent epimerase/dehydratase domain-containing protein n=1 Tax=Triparma verrucosa TaxID=1606542 RepID=A0A9W7CF45_9STRA|nr:hypothetical protein TrVE_jg8169 [Triparma verrucosa]
MFTRRRVLVAVGLAVPPALVLSASAWYREKHRPSLPAHTLGDLTGKVVVATGGSSGIGKASVQKLRDLGATVINGSRKDGSLDLADLNSVKEFTSKIVEGGRCDLVLACAAEIYTDQSQLSVQGHDATFATNHLGLQALLSGLTDELKPKRIVIVGSKLARQGLIDPPLIRSSNGKALNSRPPPFSPVKHYADTKLCNHLLSRSLSLRSPSSKVLTVSPGMVDTDLWRNFSSLYQLVTFPIRYVALRTPEDASLGVVYALAAEEIEDVPSGSFMVDGKVEEWTEKEKDEEIGEQLYGVCKEIINDAKNK